MRKESATIFWRKAAQSLPAQVRVRYAGYFERAERIERGLDGLIGLLRDFRLLRRPRGLSASSSG